MSCYLHGTSAPADLAELKALLTKVQDALDFSLFLGDIEAYLNKIATNARIIRLQTEGCLRGFIAYYCNDPDRDLAFITMVAIDPSHTRKGIGSKLLQTALDDIRACGFKRVRLEVHANNTPALHLYSNTGFRLLTLDGNRHCLELTLGAPPH